MALRWPAVPLTVLYELAKLTDSEKNTASLSREGVLTILGHGYGAVQDALARPSEMSPIVKWSTMRLSLIALGKILSSAFTISSGGAAGTFGPSMVIAGCIGGAVGIALSGLRIAPSPGACVIIGTDGFFAAYRTPIAGLLMVSELTGTYQLLIPTQYEYARFALASGKKSLVAAQACRHCIPPRIPDTSSMTYSPAYASKKPSLTHNDKLGC